MNNVWLNLPRHEPFVLPNDYPEIRNHNNSVSTPNHVIHMDLLPEPYVGNPDAEIVLLGLNPGFAEDDALLYEDSYTRGTWETNLFHQSLEYPFYLLDPSVPDISGSKWWRGKLREPIELAGERRVAQSFLCIEYFPYHSQSYKSIGKVLPSQEYSFWLLRQAIDREAVIVARSRSMWEKAVPELVDYPKVSSPRSQGFYISRGNCPEAWPFIEEILTPRAQAIVS